MQFQMTIAYEDKMISFQCPSNYIYLLSMPHFENDFFYMVQFTTYFILFILFILYFICCFLVSRNQYYSMKWLFSQEIHLKSFKNVKEPQKNGWFSIFTRLN